MVSAVVRSDAAMLIGWAIDDSRAPWAHWMTQTTIRDPVVVTNAHPMAQPTIRRLTDVTNAHPMAQPTIRRLTDGTDALQPNE